MKRILPLLLLFPYYLFAQVQTGEQPVSAGMKALSDIVPTIHLKQPDIASIEQKNLADTTPRPFKFGEKIPVFITPQTEGRWTEFAGGRLWKLRLESKGALSLNFMFDKFNIPPGSKFFIYNHTDTLGAFTQENVQEDYVFATTLLKGDYVFLEYFEPYNASFAGEIVLSQVVYGYKDAFEYAKVFGAAGSCHNNANCASGSNWADQKRSVVMLVIDGEGFCSGSLINNTSQDNKPYVLTANHCFTPFGSTSSWVFWFNWESQDCNNPSVSPSYQSVSGATLRARNAATDFCLVELNSPVPATYNPYFAGWSRSETPAVSGAGIHHPRGDIKKITFYNTTLTETTYAGSGFMSHWYVLWSSGVTEGGSSGSPLFDNNKRIVGQLHGGDSYCGATGTSLNDKYGKFNYSWTGGGTPATRLQDWLDPGSTNSMFMDGKNTCIIAATLTPSSSMVYCGSSGVNFTISNVPGAVYQWKRNGVNVGTNSTSYVATSAGSYTVTVTTSSCSAVFGPVVLSVPEFTPLVSSSEGNKLCQGAGQGSLVLKAIPIAGLESPVYQWKWNGYVMGGTSTDSVVVSNAGNYSLVVTACGVTRESSAFTVVNPPKSPGVPAVTKYTCQFDTSHLPDYRLIINDICGPAFQNFQYNGPVVGYDGGGRSGDDPFIQILGTDEIKSIKIRIKWEKKSAAGLNSCGSAHDGGSPFNGEVSFRLRAPSGSIYNLVYSGTYSGAYGGVVETYFSDLATAFPSGTPASGTFKPAQSLSGLVGQSSNGIWTLLPNDNAGGDPLCVLEFGLEIGVSNNHSWFSESSLTNLINQGNEYVAPSPADGSNSFYVVSECSVFCPSDPVEVKLVLDCNCANSTNLAIQGQIQLTKQTPGSIQSLTPNSIIENKKVEYKAGSYVLLEPGFIAQPINGGAFTARIEGCN